MLILGIDPGTATTGYGVIEVNDKNVRVIEYGLIETSKINSAGERLLSIQKELTVILENHKPDCMAIERLFFATNAKTAMRVGQALGVMIYSAALSGVEVFEYAPGTIKKVITGNGRADKKEIQKFIQKSLNGEVSSKSVGKTHFDNAADALAVAVCHAMQNKLTQ